VFCCLSCKVKLAGTTRVVVDGTLCLCNVQYSDSVLSAAIAAAAQAAVIGGTSLLNVQQH
jgi:hypothetical protein